MNLGKFMGGFHSKTFFYKIFRNKYLISFFVYLSIISTEHKPLNWNAT